MNRSEFNEWWADFASAYPDTAAWVAKTGGADLLRRWSWCFERVTLVDAQEVTRLMLSGEVEKPKAYEREDTPAIITRQCARLVNARCEAARNEELLRPRPKADRFAAGEMFRRLVELKETMDHEAACRIMREEFCQ